MKIGIMCSLTFSEEVGKIKKQLENAGHEVSVPISTGKILNGELTLEKVDEMKRDGTISSYMDSENLIRRNWDRMQDEDAVLVVNLEKNGIKNYIGANTFLEIGFAHVLKKKIFFWAGMPDMPYHKDEIEAMSPVLLNGDVSLIQ